MDHKILPVFAGMIPTSSFFCDAVANSPRIRGDDPDGTAARHPLDQFSPYSRG